MPRGYDVTGRSIVFRRFCMGELIMISWKGFFIYVSG